MGLGGMRAPGLHPPACHLFTYAFMPFIHPSHTTTYTSELHPLPCLHVIHLPVPDAIHLPSPRHTHMHTHTICTTCMSFICPPTPTPPTHTHT